MCKLYLSISRGEKNEKVQEKYCISNNKFAIYYIIIIT